MRLLHYANREIPEVTRHPNFGREDEYPIPNNKPIGLWVSVDGQYGWKEWCLDNNWSRHNLSHTHEVILKPDAKILHLTDRESIIKFHKNYSFDLLDTYGVKQITHGHTLMMVAWQNVAEDYQGIVISPYGNNDLRYQIGMTWYYAWDCASGCIWDHTAVESIKLI